MKPRIGSLCSGAGGLDLAVEEVFGAETVWHVERDAAAAKVLAARWHVPNHGDLQATDWASVEPIDIMAAGYPCQPDSLAGKGLSQDDERWIWPDIATAIGVLRPGIIVLENVPGHFVRGFRTVLGSLTVLGYDARWTLVRASDVGAPHRRERLFAVAENTDRAACGEWRQSAPGQTQRGWARPDTGGRDRAPLTDAGGSGRGEEDPRRRDVERQGGIQAGWDESAGTSRSDRDAAANADRRAIRQQPVSEPWSGSASVAGLAVQRPTAPDSYGDGLQGVGRLEPVGRDTHGRGSTDTAWGQYEPAIRRWERLTRVAPAPTEPNSKGGQRLSPRFVEWMQGYAEGWVCDVPGVSRNDQLKILGNSVVQQQGAYALRRLLDSAARAVA